MTLPPPSPLSYAEEARWSKERKRGAKFFIVAYGCLACAVIAATQMMMHLLFGHTHYKFTGSDLVITLSVWLITGFAYSTFIWRQTERRYKFTVAKFGKSTEGND
jgi:hypothetical protein